MVLLVTTEHVESNARTMFGCQLSVWMHLSMHHQKSSSDSPFHANTGYPASARAAATSFYRGTYRRALKKGSTGITIRPHYSLPLLMYVLYVIGNQLILSNHQKLLKLHSIKDNLQFWRTQMCNTALLTLFIKFQQNEWLTNPLPNNEIYASIIITDYSLTIKCQQFWWQNNWYGFQFCLFTKLHNKT